MQDNAKDQKPQLDHKQTQRRRSIMKNNLNPKQNDKAHGQKGDGKKRPSRTMHEVFKLDPQGQKQEKQTSSVVSNVKLENSQSSMRSSVASFSLNASSLMSGKSMLMSKRSSSKKAVLKQVIGFGSEERIHMNPKNINRVRLTRYTLLSFVPLSLLFQFKRAANIYFLVISILSCLSFSPKDPTSMIGTFAFVLVLTMIKEAYEDYQRYKNQNELNQKKAKVFNYSTQKFEFTQWQNIKAGMIIRLEKDCEVPADVLVLYSSNVSGLVFVDTMALDGETNLKEKMAICESFDEKNVGKLNGEMTIDSPNELLDYWEGSIQSSTIQQKAPCSIKNLMLRGSFIRNTKYTYGIVAYTGMQTKILKNLKKPPHKVSNVMKKMNLMLYTVFAFQVLVILIFAALNKKWVDDHYATHNETLGLSSDATSVGETFVLQLLVYWVAYSHLIPISLYVIIEMLKLGQSYLINKDVMMYDKETNSFAKCRNSDLIEELGQVEMIFSDKTGTLTMNKMVFKKCQIYGERVGDAEPGEGCEAIEGMAQSGISKIKQHIKEESKRFYKSLRDPTIKDSVYDYPYLNFAKVLTLCHTVVCDIDVITKEIRYQASSPDELALVQGARDFGYELVSRNHSKLEIDNRVIDVKEIFKVVAEFPFDSTRKCMSVIVRDQFQKYYLLTKGADSVMLEKINFAKSKQEGLEEKVKSDLSYYSTEGFRTLVMGMRQVSEEEFETYQSIYTKLVNSSHPYKDKKIVELYQKMEQKLRYVGATAIEDKLQDVSLTFIHRLQGVPQTIAMLIRADIRFWMLTGDKLETAVEIAKSCRILLEGDQLLILSTNDFELLSKTLDNEIEIYGLSIDKKVTSLKNHQQQKFVIAIDGSTLNLVLEDPELEQKFFYVSLVAKSVVCCRVSPKQKADIVALYKKRGSWVTLSIGDGANDVSMILEANIGVGIKGKEGTQAVRSADYAISQFRFLLRLLIVHGRWGYRRVSKMICYYFYKNVILVFTEIYFAFYNGFSGQIYFLDWLPMLYNAVFTSWPCLLAFNFEEDVNHNYAYKYPIVYKSGQQGVYFNFQIFWKSIFLAMWHGVVCFYVPMMSFSATPWDSNGRTQEMWFISTMTFSFIIHIVSYKLFIESNFWNIFSFIAAILCVALYYIITLMGSSDAMASALQPALNGMMIRILQSPKYYVMLIAIPWICLLPDFLLKHGRAIFRPYPSELIMIEQKKNPKYSFFETAIKDDVKSFLTGVMKKNRSYGQLTSKALSEIDKLSNMSKVRSIDNFSMGTSIKKLGQSGFKIGSPTSVEQTPQLRSEINKKVKGLEKRRIQMYEQSVDREAEEGNLKNEGTSSDNGNYVEVKAKKKERRLNKLKNAWVDDKDKTTVKKKKRNKGNETTHNLLDESNTDNEMANNTVSSQLLKEQLTRNLKNKEQKTRDMEEQLGIDTSGVIGKKDNKSDNEEATSNNDTDDDSNHQDYVSKTKVKDRSEMREQSYQERKKNLIENIKKDMKQQQIDQYKRLQESYHSTSQNNQQVIERLEYINKIAQDQMSQRKVKNTKKAVRDLLYTPGTNAQVLGSQISGNDKNYNSDIPYMIYLGNSSSDTGTNTYSNYGASHHSYHLPPQQLRSEGHPLEKASSLTQKTQRKRRKKYVQKYRELIKFSEQLDKVNEEEKDAHHSNSEFQL